MSEHEVMTHISAKSDHHHGNPPTFTASTHFEKCDSEQLGGENLPSAVCERNTGPVAKCSQVSVAINVFIAPTHTRMEHYF